MISPDVSQVATQLADAVGKLDVGPPPGHVGGHGDATAAAGLGHDLGFLGDVIRVQHVVFDALALQERRQMLRLVDRAGADQHGAPGGVQLADLVDDRFPLFVGPAEDAVGQALANRACVKAGQMSAEIVSTVNKDPKLPPGEGKQVTTFRCSASPPRPG